MNYKKGFTLIELLVVIAIIGVLSSVVLASLGKARIKSRDSARISQLRQIRYALELYYDTNGNYPTCLKAGGTCTTVLEGSGFIPSIPKDPLSGLSYTYAARGSGTTCSSFHLGASLEDKTNTILQGTDGTIQPICTGSLAGFSGLSYAAGGQPCNATAGTAQPTALATGESCYDLFP